MKIGILHHDLEWAEKMFDKEFKKMEIESKLYDIRTTSLEELEKNDFILNRIYASVANRDCKSNLRALKLLEKLEKKGIPCINSFLTTKNDYDKYFSFLEMDKAKIRNPKTRIISKKSEIMKAVDLGMIYGYPLIVKRKMGGRGKDVILVKNEEELKQKLENFLEHKNQYNQGYIVQEFLENNRGYDCRIAIINNKFGFSFKRTLIPSKKGEINWLASTSLGSKKEKYSPSKEEIEIAIKATKSIGAIFNEVDMTFTDEGPAIIENNPTPNYVEGQDLEKLQIAARLIVNKFKEIENENSN